MPTSLSIYQSLALSDSAALSLRKHSARRLLAMEQRLDELASERLVIEGAMRSESVQARHGTCRGMVNAESGAQSATAPVRVMDSHDARPGSARASERPYSVSTFKHDVVTGRPAAALCGVCTTARVPLWALELDVDAQRELAARMPGGIRKFADPSDESSERAPRVRQAANDARAERAAALRQAATSAKLTR